jgi:hypothetical protein
MANRKQSSEDADILAAAKDEFARIEDVERENRTTALESILFARKGEQWPEHIRKLREAERRPILTINKLPAFIRQVVNDSRMNKPSIKIRPVDGKADPETADVISGLIRNIEYVSNADVAYDTAVESAVSGGIGYWRVTMDYSYEDSFEMDLGIQRIGNPFSVYGDPNSRAADSSDWDVAFVVDRLSKRQYERKYGSADSKIDWDSDAWRNLAEPWMDSDGVQVAEYWTREEVKRRILRFTDTRSGEMFVTDEDGVQDEDVAPLIELGVLQFMDEREGIKHKVTQRIMSGAELLKTTEWPGCYIPIVPVYGEEIDVEGKRYFRSLIWHAMDPQREYNFWRTAAAELVALAPRVPFIGPKGAFDDDPNWQVANTHSLAYLEYKGNVPPQRQPLDIGPAVGNMQMALAASDDIKAVTGIHDASLGQRSNETSGKAIMARQREGDVSTFHFIDNMSRAIRHTGRILVDLIPKVYTTERIVRVIGEDGKEETKQVNAPYPVRDPRSGEPVTQVVGRDQRTGLPLEEAVTAMHDLRVGKYDVAVDTGPSFTTRREEASIAMTEIVRAHPPAAPILAPEIIKNMDFPNAQEISEKFEKMAEGQVPPQVQKMIEQGKQELLKLQQENAQLKMSAAEDQAKLQADIQAAQAKLEADKQVEALRIQSDKEIAMMRIAAEKEIAAYKANVQAEASIQSAAMRPQPQPGFRQPAE